MINRRDPRRTRDPDERAEDARPTGDSARGGPDELWADEWVQANERVRAAERARAAERVGAEERLQAANPAWQGAGPVPRRDRSRADGPAAELASPGGAGRRDPERNGGTAGVGSSLPELLHSARERKGVDLYRAERDTKIRARYLAALERGDYRELPGSVYTKGFLRNYALYLGLDPEEVLGLWRRERGDARPDPPIVVRRSLPTPARALTVSPSVVVAGLMILVVAALGVYLSVQLLRFAKPPTLDVTRPATAVVDAAESDTTYVVQGRSIAGATISITTPGREQPYRATALADGTWSIQVDLRRGQNKFEITALDPETGREAESPRVIQISVPFVVVQAPTLTLSQPVDGTTYENGAIPVEGTTTNATSVDVSAAWLGPPGSTDAAPPAGASVPAVAPQTVKVKEDGTFASPLELTTGRWAITVTVTSPQGKSASLTRTITIAYKGVTLVVSIKGQAVWLKAWVDGVVDPGLTASGKTMPNGSTLTFTGQKTIEIRTGSSGSTFFTLNGTSVGSLGRVGIPETWLFEPPNAPVLTKRL